MPLGITASLVGSTDPRPVQVAVTGLTVGVPYTVTASSGTWSRVVRGADTREAEATTELLVDIMTPLNAPITYTVTSGGSSASDVDAVTVSSDVDWLLHSLDRALTAEFQSVWNDDERQVSVRAAVYAIPGRVYPVTRYDVAGADSGEWRLLATDAQSTQVRALIASGEPVVSRTALGAGGVPPVSVAQVTSASRTTLTGGATVQREWALRWVEVDDPDADTILVLDTFADFNAVYSGDTFADLNTAWSGLTFADVNALDWAGGSGRL